VQVRGQPFEGQSLPAGSAQHITSSADSQAPVQLPGNVPRGPVPSPHGDNSAQSGASVADAIARMNLRTLATLNLQASAVPLFNSAHAAGLASPPQPDDEQQAAAGASSLSASASESPHSAHNSSAVPNEGASDISAAGAQAQHPADLCKALAMVSLAGLERARNTAFCQGCDLGVRPEE
jgi:hypothetical protein